MILCKTFETLKNLSTETIWIREIIRCIELGFHEKLKMTEEQFMNKNFFPLPENKPNPLAIIPEAILNVSIQMQLIGGNNKMKLIEHKNLIQIPKKIFWIYKVEDGSRFATKNPLTSPLQEVKIIENESRVGFTTIHGIALIRRFPQILKHHFLDFSNSLYYSSLIPCLSLSHDKPKLFASYAGIAFSNYGTPSFSNV